MHNSEDPSWMRARRGINLLLNDRNIEAEQLFNRDPSNIHMTAGICYVTFLNAIMCFDDSRVSEAIIEIKKIEEECATQIGWVKSIKNKLFYSSDHREKTLEQVLEEKIVLADSLVCQSFLTFLRNDFTSYMRGGWTLRKAWKIYQHTYEQLSMLHKKIFGYSASGLSQFDECMNMAPSNSSTTSNSCWSICEGDVNSAAANTGGESSKAANCIYSTPVKNKQLVAIQNMYSCTSKTISDFSEISNKKDKPYNNKRNKNEDVFYDALEKCDHYESTSSINSLSDHSTSFRPKSMNGSYSNDRAFTNNNGGSMRKSVSLFSSINSFGSAIYESATSLIGLKSNYVDDWETIDPEAILRLMSAVCFGYGVFRLCVSLAPSYILKWMNMLGFEGDQNVAIESLNYSRKGTDMRAPLASLALLWYHTIVRPFFTLDSEVVESSIKEATKILREEKEFENSALFLFFLGRVERIKPNIQGAIKAYEQSVANAAITDVKLLGLHEVGWCHLLVLDYQQAHKCFLQLRHQSKWSKSFYSYMATINAGACGNIDYVVQGKREIIRLLNHSNNKVAQIDKYIRNRTKNLPEPTQNDEEWVKDPTYWRLYCFEMLYLWNTFPSCNKEDLQLIINTCTPEDNEISLHHEPMLGIGWLIKGAACVVLANQLKVNNGYVNQTSHETTTHQLLDNAVDAFRKCLHIRSNNCTDVHISAFAQYELALLLLRNEETRPEGKMLLMKSQSQYKDFDFEQRLNVRISSTLRSVQKYEEEKKNGRT